MFNSQNAEKQKMKIKEIKEGWIDIYTALKTTDCEQCPVQSTPITSKPALLCHTVIKDLCKILHFCS